MFLRQPSLLILLILNVSRSINSYKCDFFQDVTLRVTPKTVFPYPSVYEVEKFSGCIEQTAFDEVLTAIIFFGQNVTRIGDHAIDQMPQLEKLGFNGCKINTVARRAFRNLPKLKELYIQFGNLKKIEVNIFNEISSLEILNLYENQISEIQAHAFGFMPNLKQLIVSKNKLNHLYGIWFANSSNIELLDFSENRIVNISRFVFPRMLNLKDIFLDFNEIVYIENGAFENLGNLTYLGLSHNRLVGINPKIFPEKFHIDSLMINANYLNFLSNELLQKLSVNEITLEGNPWKCPCLDKIHKWIARKKSSIRSTNFCIGDNIPRCFYADEDRFCSETNNEEMTGSYLKTLRGLKTPIHSHCARLDKNI